MAITTHVNLLTKRGSLGNMESKTARKLFVLILFASLSMVSGVVLTSLAGCSNASDTTHYMRGVRAARAGIVPQANPCTYQGDRIEWLEGWMSVESRSRGAESKIRETTITKAKT